MFDTRTTSGQAVSIPPPSPLPPFWSGYQMEMPAPAEKKERKTETERSTLFDGALDKYLPRLPLAYTKMEK